MSDKISQMDRGSISNLILQALIRKLLAKNVLSQQDVQELLFEAATRLDVLGSEQTPQAARIMVEEDLAPLFLDNADR